MQNRRWNYSLTLTIQWGNTARIMSAFTSGETITCVWQENINKYWLFKAKEYILDTVGNAAELPCYRGSLPLIKFLLGAIRQSQTFLLSWMVDETWFCLLFSSFPVTHCLISLYKERRIKESISRDWALPRFGVCYQFQPRWCSVYRCTCAATVLSSPILQYCSFKQQLLCPELCTLPIVNSFQEKGRI